MVSVTEYGKSIVIKPRLVRLIVGLLSLLIAIVLICIFPRILPSGRSLMALDFIGIAVVFLSILLALYIFVWSFIAATSKVKITSEGITYTMPFKKRTLSWSDVRDFGISFYAFFPKEGSAFLLYFSDQVLQNKSENRKKMRRGTIRFVVTGRDYEECIDTVLPFCTDFTSVEPFIGKSKLPF